MSDPIDPVICRTNTDTGVVMLTFCILPHGEERENHIERVVEGMPYIEVLKASLPTQEAIRNAWVIDGATVVVDPVRAEPKPY